MHRHQTPDTDLRTQLSLAGHVSGQEFHEASQDHMGIGHRPMDHTQVKQGCRSHLTSACQKVRGEVGRDLFSPGIPCTPQAASSWVSSLWIQIQTQQLFAFFLGIVSSVYEYKTSSTKGKIPGVLWENLFPLNFVYSFSLSLSQRIKVLLTTVSVAYGV